MSSNGAKYFISLPLFLAIFSLGQFSSRCTLQKTCLLPETKRQHAPLLKCEPWSRSTPSSSDRSRQTWAPETFCVTFSQEEVVSAPWLYPCRSAFTDAGCSSNTTGTTQGITTGHQVAQDQDGVEMVPLQDVRRCPKNMYRLMICDWAAKEEQ